MRFFSSAGNIVKYISKCRFTVLETSTVKTLTSDIQTEQKFVLPFQIEYI